MNLKNEDYLKVCMKGDLKQVKEKFKHLNREHIESIRDNHKASCLHYAARNGCLSILEYLIAEKNVSPFLVSEVGASAIHDAAVKGRLNVIEWMISKTDLNSSFKDADGATIIHLASKFNHTNVIEWILSKESARAAKTQTFNGATCLHFACANNSFNALKILLNAIPGYVNVQMVNGVTPVYLAIQENNFQMVKYLIKYGANINIRAEDGMNGIHVACQNGSLEMVRMLFEEFRGNLNERDYNGATPLHFACMNGNKTLVAYLLSNGAKITIDKFGNSPLHDCSVGGFIECARLLLANNCDPLLKDNHFMTSADIAESYGHHDFVKELRRFEKKNLQTLKPQNKTSIVICKDQDDATTVESNPYLAINEKQRSNVLNRSLRKTTSSNSILEERRPSLKSRIDITKLELIGQQQQQQNGVNQIVIMPSSTSNQQITSVTSPITYFNSSSVVSTSTPSSEDQVNQTNAHLEEAISVQHALPPPPPPPLPVSLPPPLTSPPRFLNDKTYVVQSKPVTPNQVFVDANSNKTYDIIQTVPKFNNQENVDDSNAIEYKSTTSSNQIFIKIIRQEDRNVIVEQPKQNATHSRTSSGSNAISIVGNKMSPNDSSYRTNNVSAIDELDKCIAEFEISGRDSSKQNDSFNNTVNKNILATNPNDKHASIKSNKSVDQKNELDRELILKSNLKLNASLVSADANNNNVYNDNNTHASKPTNLYKKNNAANQFNNANTNRVKQTTTLPASLPPPPPPPLPTNWLSLNEKTFLRSSNKGEHSNTNEKSGNVTNSNVRTPKTPVNFMDELQNQLRSGKSLLKKKSLDKLDMESINQENLDFVESDFKANLDYIKHLQRSQPRPQTQLPEWKQKLIEKKRQQQRQASSDLLY